MIRTHKFILTVLGLALLLQFLPITITAQELDDLNLKRRALLERFRNAEGPERKAILKKLMGMKLEEQRRRGFKVDTENRLPTAEEIDRFYGAMPVSSSLGLGGILAEDGDLSDRDLQKIIGLATKDGISTEERGDLQDLLDLYGDVMSEETNGDLTDLLSGENGTEYTLRSTNDTWTSSYFPMAGGGIDDEGSSGKNLWAKDGAMSKIDKVIEARTGTPGNAYETESRPALNWLVDKEKGFWIPNSTIREDDAERTTGVDFNGNGKIDPDVEWDFIDSRGNFGEDGKKDGTMGVGWWGRCNNVGIAGTLFKEPKRSVTVDGVTFSPTEIKGLLAVYSDTILESKGSEFVGNRYDDQPDLLITKDGKTLRGVIENSGELDFYSKDMWRPNKPGYKDYMVLDTDALGERDKEIRFRDLSTGEVTTYKHEDLNLVAKEDSKQDMEASVFHNTMTEWLADGRAGVLEMDPGSHVWNYNYESANIKESTERPYWAPEGEDLTGYNGKAGEGEITYFDSTVKYDGAGSTQRYKYWIEKDAEGNVVNSGFSGKNPDFMWRANETEVDWNRKVPGHPSLDGNLIKELYEKSTAEDPAPAPAEASAEDDNN